MYIQVVNSALLLCATAAVLIVNRRGENLIIFPNDIDADVIILILTENKITRIEDNSVASLIALEKLVVDFNGVEFIGTNAFVNNIHLRRLQLVGHRLSNMPPEVGGAWNTLAIFKFGQGETYLPAVRLINFTALTTIHMNKIWTQPPILRGLPSLKFLSAQQCKLQEFPDLSGAPQVEEVQLNRNDFTWVPRSALVGLSRLRKVRLQECRVMHLPDMSHLVSLETILAHRNALTTVPDMYDLTITELNLAHNPLMCDKALCWIRMWDYFKSPLDVARSEKGTCAEPAHLRGLLINAHPVDMKCYEGNS